MKTLKHIKKRVNTFISIYLFLLETHHIGKGHKQQS